MTDGRVSVKGDTERQAALRDRLIKGSPEAKDEAYVSRIHAVLRPGMRFLDIGCGTAHVIRKLAEGHKSAILVGLDISPAMLRTARTNTGRSPNVTLVEADGLNLPFQNFVFDIVITRLAEYSPTEVCRVLRRRGYFFEYGLGPAANIEIVEFFSDRIERENFFFPRSLEEWRAEACAEVRGAGFAIDNIEDYKEYGYYRDEEELADLIEMVPLVRDFDRKKDRQMIDKLAAKYGEQKGIRVTWHYYIMQARRV